MMSTSVVSALLFSYFLISSLHLLKKKKFGCKHATTSHIREQIRLLISLISVRFTIKCQYKNKPPQISLDYQKKKPRTAVSGLGMAGSWRLSSVRNGGT